MLISNSSRMVGNSRPHSKKQVIVEGRGPVIPVLKIQSLACLPLKTFLETAPMPDSMSGLLVIRELTKPSCYIRRYLKDFGQLVDVKRNKNLLDSQCVGGVYARSAMRGKERSTEPRQA